MLNRVGRHTSPCETFGRRQADRRRVRPVAVPCLSDRIMTPSALNNVDLSQSLGRKAYEKRLIPLQERFLALRLQLGGQVGHTL